MDIGANRCTDGINPTISEQDYEYILNHSEACYCFVSDKEVLAKIN
jgi:long-chain acyl-CoA synthetase